MTKKTVVDFPRKTGNQNHSAHQQQQRLAWSGLSREELSRPGATLLACLVQTANRDGLQMKELADRLGVTYGYIAQLRNGQRNIPHISETFVARCADFLRVPAIVVKIAAGKICPEDFIFPEDEYEARLDSALAHIHSDTAFGPWMPATAMQLDVSVKTFIVLCYQQATGVTLFTEHRILPSLMQDVQAAVAGQGTFFDS